MKISCSQVATAALTANSRLQLGQTLPGSATGIGGWAPVVDRKCRVNFRLSWLPPSTDDLRPFWGAPLTKIASNSERVRNGRTPCQRERHSVAEHSVVLSGSASNSSNLGHFRADGGDGALTKRRPRFERETFGSRNSSRTDDSLVDRRVCPGLDASAKESVCEAVVACRERAAPPTETGTLVVLRVLALAWIALSSGLWFQ